MRRLTSLIKKIVPFPAETRDEFIKIIKVLDLMPGEWIPDDLPTGTSIFVEEGLLLLTQCDNKQWKCTNFYPEGTATITYSEGAAEMVEGSLRLRAVEPSRIYYLTRDDVRRVEGFFPGYRIAGSILRQRSFFKSQRLKELFTVPPPDRIIYVSLYFRSLLRAPLEDLAQYLRLERDIDKRILDAIQKGTLSPKNQTVERHS